ncbi:insulinase family protein [candidate division WWE3 bacterium]|uniref:Insulinase family protein n=1 Tax=candidate division WWE3 bacterium TaxID=2053526 RepID=A0A955RWG9_UNCKA|nr:insulinase family protein [candidate division WWE3 bacterium]
MKLEFPYSIEKLNGSLDFLSVPSSQSPSVTVAIFAGVGARHESESENGISHVIEHMAFKGTTNRPGRKNISSEIASYGGVSNAATGYEYTYYYVKMPAYHWEKALDIVSDLTLNPLYPAEELEKEKTVIVQEFNMYEDNPHMKLMNDFREMVWPGHPLGRKISGVPETILGFDKKDLHDFRAKYYTKNNLLVSISGNYDEKKAREIVSTYFSKLDENGTPHYQDASEATPSGTLKVIQRDQEAIDLMLAYKGFNRTQERELEILGVLNTILGNGDNSRLFQNIRDDKGLTYYIGSGHTDYMDDGLFYVRAGIAPDNLKLALDSIQEEIVRIASTSVSNDELAIAKEYLKGRLLMDLETSEDVLQYYAIQQLLDPSVLSPQEMINRIESVTAKDIQQIAQKLFADRQSYVGLIGPVKDSQITELEQFVA